MRATLNSVHISQYKVRAIAKIVRLKPVNSALNLLKLMPKKAAKVLYKVILSAASNAKSNFKQNINNLYVSSLRVDQGMVYKRFIPRSRGRANPIRKPTSNIMVEVAVMPENKKKITKVKSQENPKIKKESKTEK
jgi:large subunit ribosomal protein L22